MTRNDGSDWTDCKGADVILLADYRSYHPDVAAALALLNGVSRDPGSLVAIARDCIRGLEILAERGDSSSRVCQAVMNGAFIAWLAIGEFVGISYERAVEVLSRMPPAPPAG